MAWLSTKVVERSILHYTNKERRKRGIKPLSGNRALAKAARGHSRWMANTGRYGHKGAGGSTPSARAAKAGYHHGAGENIWMARGGRSRKGTAWKSKFRWDNDWRLGKAAVISWMNSPGHKANLLDNGYRHIGIGVARNRRGAFYLTQNFGNGFDARFLFKSLLSLWWLLVLGFAAVAYCGGVSGRF